MKAERRHGLKENDLAHILGQWAQYLRDHGTTVALIAVAVIAVTGLASFGKHARRRALDELWARKAALSVDVTDPDKARAALTTLTDLTTDATDPGFVMGALIERGAMALQLAAKADNPPDPDMTDQAAAAYQQLLEQFPDNPLAVALAHCGLATVEENRFVLDDDPHHKAAARRHLETVRDDPRLNATPFKSADLNASVLKRINALDEVFTRVVFAPSPKPTPEPTVVGTGASAGGTGAAVPAGRATGGPAGTDVPPERIIIGPGNPTTGPRSPAVGTGGSATGADDATRESTPKDQPKTGPQDDPKTDTQDDPKAGTQDDPKTGTQDAPKTGTQDDPKADTQDDPKTGTQDHPKTGAQDHPKS